MLNIYFFKIFHWHIRVYQLKISVSIVQCQLLRREGWMKVRERGEWMSGHQHTSVQAGRGLIHNTILGRQNFSLSRNFPHALSQLMERKEKTEKRPFSLWWKTNENGMIPAIPPSTILMMSRIKVKQFLKMAFYLSWERILACFQENKIKKSIKNMKGEIQFLNRITK